MADYLGYERAFKRAGLPYSFEPGWMNRGHGDIPHEKVKFIVLHHTAGGNDLGDLNSVRDGTNGLKGPLSQILFKRDGSAHVVAAGVSWHAYGEISFRGIPAGSGNYYSIGIEGVSRGTYDDWTPAQRKNYPRLVAALLVDLGLDEKAWITHRRYQPKTKVDPVAMTEAWLQQEISRHYNDIKGNNKPVRPAIEVLAEEQKLGKAETDERVCPDKIGRNRVYEKGMVYWTPQLGAHSVLGDNLKKYAMIGYEKSILGYPVTSERKIRDSGTYQRFQNGNMYHTPKYGSKLVYGSIFNKWGELKYENGPLGYPISDEQDAKVDGGRFNEFEFGTVYWSAKTGAHEVHGLIRDAFLKVGLETAGFPITDERETPGGEGKYNHFQNGSVYWKIGQKSAVYVPGWVKDAWSQLGWEQGTLGFPVSNIVDAEGMKQMGFEGGSIGYDILNDQTLIKIDGKWAPVNKEPEVEEEKKSEKPATSRPELKVGDFVIDYSAGVPSAKDVKNAGYKGAVRYISPARESWMKGKPMSKEEFDDYKRNGLQVAFVFQNLKQDWVRGYSGGVEDAKAAKKHIEYLGVPDAVVYCAIDSNLADKAPEATAIWNRTASEYVKGFESIMGKERTGLYANNLCIDWAIEDGLASYYWQHDWSNDIIVNNRWKRLVGVNKNAHIHQFPFRQGDKVGSLDIDRNEVLKPYFGQV